MIDLNTPEVRFALESIQRASRLVQYIQFELVTPMLEKDDRSPVTVADYVSQALIGKLILDTFPNDPLVAEEDASFLRDPQKRETLEAVTKFVRREINPIDPTSVCAWIDHGKSEPARRFWTLDPIDGTKGFLRGNQYAVALALVIEGQVMIGVLGCPKLNDAHRQEMNGPGSLVIAVYNQGCWTTSLEVPGNYRRLRVSACADASQARILRSYEDEHTSAEQINHFARQLGQNIEPIRMDSQAKYAVLASGNGDLLLRLLNPDQLDYREKIWDQAAGSLIIEEAGGQISDLRGKPLDFNTGRTLFKNQGILASNGYLHHAAMQALLAVGAS